jgi:hypothetical protein
MTIRIPDSGPVHANRVDGNALAGMLDGLFSSDMTMALIECRHCHSRSLLAEAVVELSERSAIALCRSCTHTLFTVILTEGSGAEGSGTILFEGLEQLSARM